MTQAKKKKRLTKREYYLLMNLLKSLDGQGYTFGKDNCLKGEFDEIRDKCLDRGFDYKT